MINHDQNLRTTRTPTRLDFATKMMKIIVKMNATPPKVNNVKERQIIC